MHGSVADCRGGVLSENRLRWRALVIVPLAMATGAIPLAPNGLGTFEVSAEFLYQHLPNGMAALPAQGLWLPWLPLDHGADCDDRRRRLFSEAGASMSEVLHERKNV